MKQMIVSAPSGLSMRVKPDQSSYLVRVFPIKTVVDVIGNTLSSSDGKEWVEVKNGVYTGWMWSLWLEEHDQTAVNATEEESLNLSLMHWPTEHIHGPVEWEHTWLTQKFGANKSYYKKLNKNLNGHDGIDMHAPMNSRFYAPVDMVVTRFGFHNAYGGHIRGKNGKFTIIMAHMTWPSSINWSVGQNIKAGDILGFSGNTGNSSAPHLHLRISHDDAYRGGFMYQGHPYHMIDPLPYLLNLKSRLPATGGLSVRNVS